MEDVSLMEAKENLADLLQRVAQGEEVRISDPAFGTVKLERVVGPIIKPKRVPGLWKDKISDPPDGFFDPMAEEELKDWYGDDSEAVT